MFENGIVFENLNKFTSGHYVDPRLALLETSMTSNVTDILPSPIPKPLTDYQIEYPYEVLTTVMILDLFLLFYKFKQDKEMSDLEEMDGEKKHSTTKCSGVLSKVCLCRYDLHI